MAVCCSTAFRFRSYCGTEAFFSLLPLLLTSSLTWLSPHRLAPQVLEVVADCIEQSLLSGNYVDMEVMAFWGGGGGDGVGKFAGLKINSIVGI